MNTLLGTVLGFVSGVAVSVISAFAANMLTKAREKQRMLEEQSFRIYIKLLDLYGRYFWVVGAELHGENVPEEVRKDCRSASWEIIELLRATDSGFKPLEQTMEIILGSSFSTARDRYHAMDRLIDQLGKNVNPRFTKKMKELSDANVQHFASGGSSNAPGAWTL